jgi:modulator of FtsH protease HflC
MLNRIILLVVIVSFAVPQFSFTIAEWEQGMIVRIGNPKRILSEPGLYFKVPFVDTLLRFERWVLSTDARTAEYLTLDKKRVLVDHISRWRIEKPLEFYRSMQDPQLATTRLDDLISGRLREEIAKHNFLDFVREKREEIMTVVTKDTKETAKTFGIEVLDVRIKGLDLPQEVQASVFARMRAERERIAKRYRAEGDERAREIRAGADREREVRSSAVRVMRRRRPSTPTPLAKTRSSMPLLGGCKPTKRFSARARPWCYHRTRTYSAISRAQESNSSGRGSASLGTLLLDGPVLVSPRRRRFAYRIRGTHGKASHRHGNPHVALANSRGGRARGDGRGHLSYQCRLGSRGRYCPGAT